MQSKNAFVAALFVLALCALAAGGIGLFKNIEFWRYGQAATMELADPDKGVVQFSDAFAYRSLDVRYVSEAGNIVVPGKSVPDTVAQRLADGEKIPVTYLANNPKRVFYRGEKPPSPWAWLIVGALSLAVASYALRLRKRELAGE